MAFLTRTFATGDGLSIGRSNSGKYGETIVSTNWKNGVLHSEGGQPSHLVTVAATGAKVYEAYHDNGLLHRTNGPALIRYEDGKAAYTATCIQGKIVKEEALQVASQPPIQSDAPKAAITQARAPCLRM